MGIDYIYKKYGNKANYLATRADKSDLQVHPTFDKLTDLARYQAKNRDKLINHSYQLVQLVFPYFLYM